MQDRIDALLEQFQEGYDWGDVIKAAQEKEDEKDKKKKPKDVGKLGRFKSLEMHPKGGRKKIKRGKTKPSRRFVGLDFDNLTDKEKKALAKFKKKLFGSGKPKGNLKMFMSTRKKIDIMPHSTDPTKAVIRLTATGDKARKEMENFLTVLGMPKADIVVGYKRTMAFVPKSVLPTIKAIKEARETFGDVMLRAIWEEAQAEDLGEAKNQFGSLRSTAKAAFGSEAKEKAMKAYKSAKKSGNSSAIVKAIIGLHNAGYDVSKL